MLLDSLGRKAGETAVAYLDTLGKDDPVCLFISRPTSGKASSDRFDGFKEIVLESYPNAKIIEEGDDWSRNKGFSSDINGKCSPERICNRYMEDTRGRGWWGSNDYADYYENLGSGDDPFSYIKVIPLISQEAQHKCGGFDHAGKFETSLLYALYPDHVSLEKTKENTEWFAESAKEASKELGEHMIKCTLEALEKIIN